MCRRVRGVYLDVAGSAVEVQVQVLDGAKLAEHVLYVLLGGLFVYIGDDDYPAFNGSYSCCASLGAGIAGLWVDGSLLRRVQLHFFGHDYDGIRVCIIVEYTRQ